MEQIMGGRYTARSMCGERRKRRTSEGLGDEEGVEYPDGMTVTWEIADCAILPVWSFPSGSVYFRGAEDLFVHKESLPPLGERRSTSTITMVFHLP
jgi:hypothetical protein